MRKFFYILLPVLPLLLGACEKTNDSKPKFDIVIDAEHCTVEGSYVQGAPLNSYCKAIIPYSGAKGGEVVSVQSDTVNGIVVAQQSVTLTGSKGNMTVIVSGIPIDLIPTWLPIYVALNSSSYYVGVEVAIASDSDLDGSVTFTIDTTKIADLNAPLTLDFTVDPPMTGVVVGSTPNGLAVSVSQNKSVGTGTITLNPTAAFLDGTVTLAGTFGARPVQTRNIKVNAFLAGDGSTSSPYEVNSATLMAKMAIARTSNFKITDDITLSAWTPVSGVFSGVLDGNDKSVALTINSASSDSVALFNCLGATAAVKNMTLTGAVTGRNYVAALAANRASGSTVTGVTASGVTVTGGNYVALLAAAGAAADANVLSFANAPTLINIVQGAAGATAALGVTPKNSAVTVNVGNTGMTGMYAPHYDQGTGSLTIYMPASGFHAGYITFTAQLSGASNVTSAARTIQITNDQLYKSGTGIPGDPYIVIDASQLAMTMAAYPTSYIALDADNFDLSTWTTYTTPQFTGNLDGGGYKCIGLTVPFMDNNAGTITGIKFVDVAIATNASGNLGAVARTNTGKIANVAVTGTLNTSADCLGAIAGENNNGGVITNCYANVTLTSNMSAVGGIVGRVNNSAGGKVNVIKNCTSEGAITVTGDKSQVGGILGRKTNTNNSDAIPDTIGNCFSSMKITATNSNMVAGIFGALQPNDRVLLISQCMFTGTVSAAFSVAGIAGVTHEVQDCMVLGAGGVTEVSANTISSSTTGGTAASGSGAGVVSALKGVAARCVVAEAKIAGNTANGKILGGIASSQNGNATGVSVSNSVIINSMLGTATGRGIVGSTSSLTLSNNYRKHLLASDGTAFTATDAGADEQDGADAPADFTQAWFESLGYNFTSVWAWDATNSRPVLSNVGCADAVKVQ
jgi:hypothetical protein